MIRGAARPAWLRGGVLLLGLFAILASVRAVTWQDSGSEPAAGGDVARARGLLVRLVGGLLAQQGPDGAWDPYPDATDLSEVQRTVPHALATAACARALALGVVRERPGLPEGLRRGLDALVARQRPGGTFGAMPPGSRNPWPGVNATAAAIHALAATGRPQDRDALLAALASLERTAAYRLRAGWTRGLVAMALDAAASRGARLPAGGNPRAVVSAGEALAGPESCTDEQVAEAVVRLIRGGDGAAELAGRVLGACREEGPVWTGERADLQAWWMQAWLAARVPDEGGGPWLAALLEALEEALEAPPADRIPEGWYADGITQTACAILCLAEGLDSDGFDPDPE